VFYTKWLTDFHDGQADNGYVIIIVPGAGWGRHRRPDPEWDGTRHLIAWDLCQYRGDVRILTGLELHAPLC
jgi:hypothetical protein